MQTTGAIQTTTGKVINETNGSRDPKSEFYRMSAEQCFLNNSCEFCTCHCCGLCLMILWIIGGILGIWSSSTVLELTSDGEWYTTQCINGGISYDDCCVGNKGLYGIKGSVTIVGIDCDEIETAYTITLVDRIR